MITLAGCGAATEYVTLESDGGYYRNQVASQTVRDQIRESFQSIRRLQNTVMYRTYFFEPNLEIRESQLEDLDFESASANTNVESVTNAGTAMVIYNDGYKALIVTAAHTVTHPEMIIHYAGDSSSRADNIVEAVSVRVSVNRFVITDNGIVSLEIVSVDDRKDIALLMSKSELRDDFNLNVTQIPPGNINRLDWSDIIYAVGYPRGVQMVTQGVASLSSHPNRSLALDVNINRGFSGGAVFAVRTDGSGLEWMGMITSAMGERDTYLVPEDLIDTEYNPEIPYMGNIYVKNRPVIYYGIAYAVDVSEIESFIRENQSELRRRGIELSEIL